MHSIVLILFTFDLETELMATFIYVNQLYAIMCTATLSCRAKADLLWCVNENMKAHQLISAWQNSDVTG